MIANVLFTLKNFNQKDMTMSFNYFAFENLLFVILKFHFLLFMGGPNKKLLKVENVKKIFLYLKINSKIFSGHFIFLLMIYCKLRNKKFFLLYKKYKITFDF